jgi:hypothetical protein
MLSRLVLQVGERSSVTLNVSSRDMKLGLSLTRYISSFTSFVAASDLQGHLALRKKDADLHSCRESAFGMTDPTRASEEPPEYLRAKTHSHFLTQ